MSDWGPVQEQNLVTIATQSLEACGAELVSNAAAITASTVYPSANLAIFVPFTVQAPFLAVKMGTSNGAAVSGNIDVGIFDTGGNRVVSIGTTAQAGTSALQSYDITDTLLQPGRYYMAVALDNGTGTLANWAPTAALASATGCLQAATSFVLPASVTFAAFTQNYIPEMFVTGRTLI